MVSDARIPPLLNRLAGLYRDPHRVDRDASSLLKSGVGKRLTPLVSMLVENNGNVCKTLCLQGTIAIQFKGVDYQQLMDIYIPSGYPFRPPVCYVRLASPSMYLKENHPHVGSDGQVYLPYLHEWEATTHDLIELVVQMSSVFSANPPVFTRQTPQVASSVVQPPSQASPPPTLSSVAASYQSYFQNNNTVRPTILQTTQSTSERDAILQVEEQIALEESRKEAERLRLEAIEAQQRAAQEEWDAKNFSTTKETVRRKIHAYLLQLSKTARESIQMGMMDQKKLEISEERLNYQINFLKESKLTLEEQRCVVDKSLIDIKALIESAKEQDSKKEEIPVDDRVRPVSAVDAQMLQLSADNASYSDVLYFLDLALHNHVISLSAHLKEVRNVAKKQFMARAHLSKIAQSRTHLNGTR